MATKEEVQQREAIRQHQRAAKELDAREKELSIAEYKQRARFKALDAAQYLKPSRDFNEPKGLSQNTTLVNYDIVKKAEEIYQWLIKDLNKK